MRRRRSATDNLDYEVRRRSGRERTEARRAGRARRRHMVLVLLAIFLVLGIGSAPSLVSHSPIGRSILRSTLVSYGWDGSAESFQVGWITPLRLTGLSIIGQQAGSRIEIGELQTGITLLDLYHGTPQQGDFGEISLNQVTVDCTVDHPLTSLESDLAPLLESSDPSSQSSVVGKVIVQNLQARLTDSLSGEAWVLDQSNAEVNLDAQWVALQVSGLMTEPKGEAGGLQLALKLPPSGQPELGSPIDVTLDAKTLPLSFLTLVKRRFPESELPADLTGDVSGFASVQIPTSWQPNLQLRKVECRNLIARDGQQGRLLWQNQLMTLNGDWSWQPGRIGVKQLAASTDFASVVLDGSFSDSLSFAGSSSNPLAWLDQVDATGTAKIDLPRLQAAFPGLLPLRDGVRIESGLLTAQIEPVSTTLADPNRDMRRRRLVLHSDAIAAGNAHDTIRIAPMDATAIVASNQAHLMAETFTLKSPFANISGQGDLRAGAADLQINFGKLTRMLQPILKQNSQQFQGDVVAKVNWNSLANGVWRLAGESRINALSIEIEPGQRFVQPQLDASLNVEGRMGASHAARFQLDELSKGLLIVKADGLETTVELASAIGQLDSRQPIPLRIRGNGQITSLTQMVQPWLPKQMNDTRGGFDVNARATVNGNGDAVLQSVDGQLNRLRVPWGDHDLEQELVKLHFDGKAMWPRRELVIHSLSVTGDAASASLQGEWIDGMTDVEIAWRADLDRLQTSAVGRVANQPGQSGLSMNRSPTSTSVPIQRVGFQSTKVNDSSSFLLSGKVEGNSIVVGDTATLRVDSVITGTDLALAEPVIANANNRLSVSSQTPAQRVVWAEPQLSSKQRLQWSINENRMDAQTLQLETPWCIGEFQGVLSWDDSVTDLHLSGPTRMDMSQVAKRLTAITGTPIVAEGTHQTPLEIRYAQNNQKTGTSRAGASGDYAFTVKGNLGWETVDAAGMLFGPAEIPFRMTESTVTVQSARVPVLGPSRLTLRPFGPQVAPFDYQPGQRVLTDSEQRAAQAGGEIILAGDVHYRPEVWVELQPGPIARNVHLTPDMTGKWLKYLAPIASDAAQIEGIFSADLQQAVISIDDPRQTQLRGSMQVQEVRMTAGPLADQVIASARQLQSLVAIGSAQSPPRTGRTLITLPPQTIDFTVSQGVVDHRALLMEIDRARVVTSGQVDFDGRLALTAQIPLDAKWLGADLRGLEGQTMTLPIDGTLSRPSLDSRGMRKVATEFGVKAAQDAAQNAASRFLQKQLGSGTEQLEQSLNRGLEKLRLDKLFGN